MQVRCTCIAQMVDGKLVVELYDPECEYQPHREVNSEEE